MLASTVTVEEFKVTEIGPLPKEWEVTRLGQLIEDVREKNKSDFQHPVFTVSNLYGFVLSDEFFDKRVYSKKLNTYKIVRSDYFAYNPYRVNVGSIALFDHEVGLVSPAYVVFRILKPEHLYSPFLYRLIKSPLYLDEIRRVAMSRGSVRRSLSFRDLSDFQIPLPPILEQKKIAYVLSTVQTAIEETEAVIKATRELKKSLMKHLFTYGPVSVDETENVPLKETEIGMVPERWEVLRLGDVFALSSGKARPTVIKAVPHGQHVFPVFGGNGIMGYSAEYFIDTPTVVLGRVGEYCGSVHISAPKSWISDNALYAKLFHIDVRLDYLATALSILDLNRFKKKSGQPLITQNIVCSREIPLPSLTIQQEISEILSRVHERVSAEEDKKKTLEALFKTLLTRFMTGEIRVSSLEVPV